MKRIIILFFMCFYFCFNLAKADSAQDTFVQLGNNLQSCTPGTFDIPLPIANASLTFTIMSLDANTCQLTIVQSLNGQNRVLKCLLSKEDLSSLAQSMNNPNGSSSPEALISKIKGSSCQQVP